MKARKIRDGYQPKWGEVFIGADFPGFHEHYIKVVKAMELVAIARVGDSLGDKDAGLRVMRVFN